MNIQIMIDKLIEMLPVFIAAAGMNLPRILSDMTLKKMFSENNALFASNVNTKFNIDTALLKLNEKMQETKVFKDLENKLYEGIKNVETLTSTFETKIKYVEDIISKVNETVETVNAVYNELIKFKKVNGFMEDINAKVNSDSEKLDKLLTLLGLSK